MQAYRDDDVDIFNRQLHRFRDILIKVGYGEV